MITDHRKYKLTLLKLPVLFFVCLFCCGSDVMAAEDKVASFLEHSAFIGNSIGEGLTMYNKAVDPAPLGEATMLTRVSYSFYNDRSSNKKFLPRFEGVPMRAKDAVRECGADYVFVCMGTNDLVGRAAAKGAYDEYRKFLSEIMAENPGITLFVESCPPTGPSSNVKNEKVTEFNGYMRSYCNALPHMFFVDISDPLSDKTGHLISSYSAGDGTHLTMKAYGVWADTVRSYIAGYLEDVAKEIRKKNELEHAAARRNYEKCMRQMEKAKLTARRERLAAEKNDEETAEVSPMTPEEFRQRLLSHQSSEILSMIRKTFPPEQPQFQPPETLQSLLRKQP